MKIFVAASYSSQVDYDTGKVFEPYKEWMEQQLVLLEGSGHEVFCALRADDYRINDGDPVAAFELDRAKLDWCDMVLAFTTENVSAGVQTEIGYAIAKGKRVLLAHEGKSKPAWFNQAMMQAKVIKFISEDQLQTL